LWERWHLDEFCFKKKREERMAKEWANKDKYHPSSGVLEPRVQMPRAKASVRIVPDWNRSDRFGVCRVASLVFVPVRSLGLSQVVVVLVVGLESQQVVSLLGVLPLVFNTIHGSTFVVLVLL
jgi:hypothetical protein